jgi:hypothetical protein
MCKLARLELFKPRAMEGGDKPIIINPLTLTTSYRYTLAVTHLLSLSICTPTWRCNNKQEYHGFVSAITSRHTNCHISLCSQFPLYLNVNVNIVLEIVTMITILRPPRPPPLPTFPPRPLATHVRRGGLPPPHPPRLPLRNPLTHARYHHP